MPPRLIGVIHLPPLPGSPRVRLPLAEVEAQVERDAAALAEAGFDAVVVENFGDAPFFKEEAPAVTIAAMTRCALAARRAAPRLALAINVLRNDGAAALAIAAATGAAAIRVNVLTGARVTDQGIVEGRAAELLRLRRALDAEAVEIWADVAVKHSAPLAERPLADETRDLVGRALADAVLVTGGGTGQAVDPAHLSAVREAAGGRPVLVASGASVEALPVLKDLCEGVIVGSALRVDGRAGGPIDRAVARRFSGAFRASFGPAQG